MLHYPPPFSLVTALQRLQPAQRRASTTPTSCRTCHCNVQVKKRPVVLVKVVQPSRSTELVRILLTQTLQWRARQDVGVVDALPCAGWRRG